MRSLCARGRLGASMGAVLFFTSMVPGEQFSFLMDVETDGFGASTTSGVVPVVVVVLVVVEGPGVVSGISPATGALLG